MGNDDSLVVAQIADETCAVGVVAEDGAVISDREGVYSTGMCGTRGEVIGDIDRGYLVRQGDVESPATLSDRKSVV